MAFDISNLNQSESDYKNGLSNLSGGSGGSSGAGIGALGGFIGSAFTAMQGLTMMNDGADMIKQGAAFTAGVYRSSGQAAVQGANFQAQVYRQAGDAAIVAANYNIAVDELQTNRTQDALGRQLNDVLSSNTAKIGASGVAVTSKSVMMVQNDVFSTAERQFVQNRNDADQRQAVTRYQGQLTKTQYENEARAAEYSGLVQQQAAENNARAAEYQGKVDAYKQGVAQANSIGSSIGDIFKMF